MFDMGVYSQGVLSVHFVCSSKCLIDNKKKKNTPCVGSNHIVSYFYLDVRNWKLT